MRSPARGASGGGSPAGRRRDCRSRPSNRPGRAAGRPRRRSGASLCASRFSAWWSELWPRKIDSVGAAGGHGRGEIVEAGRGEVADDEVAAARAGRVADAGEQLEQEGVVDLALAALRRRNDQGDGAGGADRAGRHVAAERIIVLARQLPDQLLGAVVDRRAVVERARRRSIWRRRPASAMSSRRVVRRLILQNLLQILPNCRKRDAWQALSSDPESC